MTVYVDGARNRLGRMVMCHMLADTTEELMDMADLIGVGRQHVQARGTAREHLDVCLAKRAAAVRAGAVAVTRRRVVELLRKRREGV